MEIPSSELESWTVNSLPNNIKNIESSEIIFYIDGDEEFSFQDSDEKQRLTSESPTKRQTLKDVINFSKQDSDHERKFQEIQTNEIAKQIETKLKINVINSFDDNSKNHLVGKVSKGKNKDFIFTPDSEFPTKYIEDASNVIEKKAPKVYIKTDYLPKFSYADAFKKNHPHAVSIVKTKNLKGKSIEKTSVKIQYSKMEKENRKNFDFDEMLDLGKLSVIGKEISILIQKETNQLEEISKLKRSFNKVKKTEEAKGKTEQKQRLDLIPLIEQIDKLNKEIAGEGIKVPFHIVDKNKMFSRMKKNLKDH